MTHEGQPMSFVVDLCEFDLTNAQARQHLRARPSPRILVGFPSCRELQGLARSPALFTARYGLDGMS